MLSESNFIISIYSAPLYSYALDEIIKWYETYMEKQNQKKIIPYTSFKVKQNNCIKRHYKQNERNKKWKTLNGK